MAEPVIEVEIAFDGKEVRLKGPESFVKSEVARLTGAVTPTPPSGTGDHDDAGLNGARNEREFVGLKKPVGHQEAVAVLGFWLTAKGKQEFTEDDVRRAYLRAGVRPPKVVAQALRDAKRDRDLIEPGVKRGTYRLTSHGDSTVRFDLPAKPPKEK